MTLEPRFEAGYDQLAMHVARSDYAVLRFEQFEKDRPEPMRTIEIRREWLEEIDGHVLPRKLVASDSRGRGRTEVEFLERNLREPPDARFTTSALLRRGK